MTHEEAVALAERSRQRIQRHTDKAVAFEAEGGPRAMAAAAIMRDCADVAHVALLRAEQRIAMGRLPEDEAKPQVARPQETGPQVNRPSTVSSEPVSREPVRRPPPASRVRSTQSSGRGSRRVLKD